MDYINKNPYSKFKVGLDETHREILFMEELKRPEDKNIDIERLSVVRDIFVFACYTGLSFSDIAKLSRIHLKQGADGKEWIIIDRHTFATSVTRGNSVLTFRCGKVTNSIVN